MLLYRFEYVFQIQLHSDRFDNELLDFLLKQLFFVSWPRLRPPCDHGAYALANFKPTLLDEELNGLVSGVGMDSQAGRQCAYGREWLPRLKLAADKSLFRGKDDLVKNWFACIELEPHECHMHNVTRVTDRVKRNLRCARQEMSGRWQYWRTD